MNPPIAPDPKRRRPPRPGWVGPLFKWELLRLARRGQDARARFILAFALLVVLTAFTFVWFPHVPPKELFFGTAQELTLQKSAKFAEQFSLTFILSQLAILCLLTPAYAAGGISEEKEKQTFIFLLVSDLTNREIVFGKFLGRLVFLLGVTFAGLPILALTQLYGGVSLKFLVMSYLLTGTTVTLLAAVSAASAVAVDTFRGALFRGYGLMVLYVVTGFGLPYISPFAIILFLYVMEAQSPDGFYMLGGIYALVQLVLAGLAIYFAVRGIRAMRAKASAIPPRDPFKGRRSRDRDRDERKSRRDAEPELVPLIDHEPVIEELVPDSEGPAPIARMIPPATKVPVAAVVAEAAPPRSEERRRPSRPRRRKEPEFLSRRPRVDPADPFYWKEKYTLGMKQTADDDSIQGLIIALGVSMGITVAFFVLLAVGAFLIVLISGSGDVGWSAKLLGVSGLGAFFAYIFVIGSAAASTVVRERQRLTLESLLAIPVDRDEILWAKWRVAVSRGWWWGIPASLTLPLALLLSSVPWLSIPTVFVVLAAIPLAASYALWLSIRCRTSTRAILWYLPMAGVLSLGPIVLWVFSDPRDLSWAMLAMAGLAILAAIAAWGFWRASLREFERDGR